MTVRGQTPSPGVAALVALPGGRFVVGTENPWIPADGEGPARPVEISPFEVARCAVTVEEFARFVEATGYVTDAERLGWSYVFGGEVDEQAVVLGRADGAPWWLGVAGATWRRPDGRDEALDRAPRDPVVHVSWNDALAYCRWSGTRLPREAEWEYAAAGGVPDRPFPWGHELVPDGVHHCNVWQGSFPTRDTAEDGYHGRAPVDVFPPNAFGLLNVIGNVWEWCGDEYEDARGGCCVQSVGGVRRVQKGGSYLCHASYCARYRVQARIGNAADCSAGNVGFRVAAGGDA